MQGSKPEHAVRLQAHAGGCGGLRAHSSDAAGTTPLTSVLTRVLTKTHLLRSQKDMAPASPAARRPPCTWALLGGGVQSWGGTSAPRAGSCVASSLTSTGQQRFL